MVKRHESLKKFLKTILNQLPQYIETYPSEEQELLKEFLSILRQYEAAEFQRQKLSNSFETYRQAIISSVDFVTLPFYWFIETYFRNALVLLSVSKFHAKDFYEYLVKHFRSNSLILGAFELIRKNISLNDLAWEELQYECNKLLLPLTKDQFLIINAVNDCIEKLGVQTLDSRHLRGLINEKIDQHKKVSDLLQFFTFIDGQWSIRFFSPAFGLDRYFFQFEIKKDKSLSDIIDFKNPNNTVLSLSDVHYSRDSKNFYYGTFYIPSKHFKEVTNYFKQFESLNTFKLKEIVRINDRYTSVSLANYQTGIGWIDSSPAKMTRLTKPLFSQKVDEKKIREKKLHISNRFNTNWTFRSHPLPIDIIKLYCRLPQKFLFTNLPFDTTNKNNRSTLTRTEIGLLKQLISNRVANISFIPWRLVYDFSLDLYIIKLPKILLNKLRVFLDLIPFCEIYITDPSIIIWARLTPKLAHWIQNQLNWTINLVLRAHYPLNLRFEWFEEETLQWKKPSIFL